MTDRLPCERTADKALAALAVDTVDLPWHAPDRQPAPHQALDLIWSRVCPDTKARSSVTARVDGWGLRKVEKRVDGQQVTGTVGAWDEQLEAAYRWLYGIGLLAVLLLTGCTTEERQNVAGTLRRMERRQGTEAGLPVDLLITTEETREETRSGTTVITPPQILPAEGMDWGTILAIGAASLGLPAGVGAGIGAAVRGRRPTPPQPTAGGAA